MLVSTNGAAKNSQTPGYTIEIGDGHGDGVTFRALVRLNGEIVGQGGACKTTYAATISGEKLAAKHAAKAIAGYIPGAKAAAPK